MNVRRVGDDGWLLELPDGDAVTAMHAALLGRPGVVESVPGWSTLLIRTDGSELPELPEPAALPAPSARTVELPVHYDGADLDEVARLTGLPVPEVVERHVSATYTVAFLGFAPGFAYLRGLDPALRVPRLATPRTSVPAGSVGLAGEQTGIYPRPSPGGWQLIGRTDAPLWDPDRDPPALLSPGDRVTFVAVP